MTTVTAQSSLYRAGDVAGPPTVEKMCHQVCSYGLALFDGAYDVEAMLAVAGQMMNVTPHPDSDDRGVTTIVELGPAADHPNAGGFSRRELMAHTDRSGVPDPPGLMMLTCAVQARVGGTSRFTDGLAVHDDLAATFPESLQALSRARSVLFGGAAGHLGAVFTSVPGAGPARVAIRLRLDDLVSFSPAVA
jgi:Taurine catabolism dioxygenase TauD, TfdA family